MILVPLGSWAQDRMMNARDYFLLGAAKFKCRACEYAVEDFDKAITMKKDYPEALYGRSLAYECLGEYRLALKDIDQAIRLRPKEVLYREGKARIRAASGDRKGAIR
ncbi:MAG: tetratricopeptide repeat protein, partial [Bacteroidota bacterium]